MSARSIRAAFTVDCCQLHIHLDAQVTRVHLSVSSRIAPRKEECFVMVAELWLLSD